MIVRVCDRCHQILYTFTSGEVVRIKQIEFDLCKYCLNYLKIKLENGDDIDDEKTL